MARKLRFFTDQARTSLASQTIIRQFQHLPAADLVWLSQVAKAGIPTGSRFGGERDLDLDTLEVSPC